MERDYPIGHPAAADYNGAPYHPTTAPFGEVYPPEHLARGGKNIDALSSPDGMHARTVQEWQDNADRTARTVQPASDAPQVQAQADTVQATTSITFTGDVRTT